MLRLSKLTDYAVVVLAALAETPARAGALHTATSLADRTGLPAPTVQKLLKQLAKAGLVQSHRGAAGGYGLSRGADRVTVAQIVEAIDGPIALTDCVDGASGACGVESLCSRRGTWDKVNQAVRRALDDVTLADMAADMAAHSPFGFEPPRAPAPGAALAG